MRIALFVTCFNDLLFPEVGEATVRLLSRLGQQIEFPERQTCCGQMHFNTGHRDECAPMVRRFVDVFGDYDQVVTPSPSCAAMVRDHHATVARDARDQGLAREAEALAPRVYDLTTYLVDVLGVTKVGAAFPHTVVFHPTCHSLRMLDVGDRPQRLLSEVRGLRLLDLAGSDECCGFGGTFSVKNADTSLAMGADKVKAILATGAEVLTSADTSCLMHLGGMLSRQGRAIRVMHIAEILASEAAS